MSELKTESFEGKSMEFVIAPPTLEDAAPIGPMHLQSWIETYQNPELGIDEVWIKENVGYVADASGTEFRTDLFEKVIAGDDNVFYRVVKDKDGEVVGFAHAVKYDDAEKLSRLEALYTLERVQGQGLGSKLMQEMLDWLGDEKPVCLQAISYNQHAIEFYERYGFALTGNKEVFKEPMEVVEMVKK